MRGASSTDGKIQFHFFNFELSSKLLGTRINLFPSHFLKWIEILELELIKIGRQKRVAMRQWIMGPATPFPNFSIYHDPRTFHLAQNRFWRNKWVWTHVLHLEDRSRRMIYAWRLHWSWIMVAKTRSWWILFEFNLFTVSLSRYKYERLRFTKILGLSLNECARREKIHETTRQSLGSASRS